MRLNSPYCIVGRGLALGMGHRWADRFRCERRFPLARKRRHGLEETFPERSGPKIVALHAVARTELKLPIGIDVEPLHPASAGRKLCARLLAGFFPQIFVLLIEDSQVPLGERVVKRSSS